MYDENEQLPQVTRDNGPITLPADVLLVVPVRNIVMFPGAVTQVALTRDFSMRAAQEAVQHGYKLGIVLQKDPSVDTPGPDDLYKIGTTVTVVRYLKAPNGVHHLICQGEQRFRTLDYLNGLPFLAARFDLIPDQVTTDANVEARAALLKQKAIEAIELLPQVPPELAPALQNIESPGALADMVAGLIDIKPAEKQTILEALKVRDRLDRVIEFLTHRVEVLKLSREIGEQTQGKLDERQREYVLREQLKTIKKELGEDDTQSELDELRQAIADAKMPEEVEKQAQKELRRLEGMPDSSMEHSMVRTYLDWLVALPWSKSDAEAIDIAKAREILDADHYGLEKVKRRILEYLAVRKLNASGRSPILCFVGPPGVGKTSLGQSIARAVGLKFVRASLGGVHDEAEIRGHRRTYIGSMPGKIVQSLRKAGTNNPVFMLDEMDKLGVGFHGDPSAALLEVLDPEQNSTFSDHYLDVPFDLSKVFFVATANVLDTIPGPLRDRMEIIELPGYTQDEKLAIATRYLVARQLKANGLTEAQAAISEDALRVVIDGYTREAGVRNLEREIGALLRHAAMKIAEGTAERVVDRRRRRARDSRRAPLRQRGQAAHERARRRDGPRLDARRRRHPVHRGHARAGQGSADPDGPARRRHEGKRAGRREPREDAPRQARRGALRARDERPAHPLAGGRDPEGRPERRRRDVPRRGVAAVGAHRAQRHRDDGRDQLARPRAADRRHQGEGAGGAARRHRHGAAAEAQREGSRGHSGAGAQAAQVRVPREHRRRARGGIRSAVRRRRERPPRRGLMKRSRR